MHRWENFKTISFLFIYFYFMRIAVLPAWKSARASDPLELELDSVSCHVDAGS